MAVVKACSLSCFYISITTKLPDMASVEKSSTYPSRANRDPGSLAINIETFSRWRPTYHLIATRGWMNDPCAPGCISSRDGGVYHVGFQWNPNGAEWDDIVWGKAFSSDLVTWEVSEVPSLERDANYDHAAVFTGCLGPAAPTRHHDGKDDSPGEVTVFYTSISRLPVHYSGEYHHGCETLSLATSKDEGRTWTKAQINPILPGPPGEVDVTGWRDPYVAPWPAMSRMLSGDHRGDNERKTLFGIISGGVRNKSPTTWLYKIDPQDTTKWEYIAPLVMPGLNFAPSIWTGDLGVNWEVTNFISLGAGEDARSQDILILGAEGCKPPYGGAGVVPGTQRCNRSQLWIAIDAIDRDRQDGSPLCKISHGGIFDHGLLYAANGFWDPVSQQQIVIGWVTEEDLPVEMQVRQGWSGCLSLPRVVSLATIHHVFRASKSALEKITNLKVEQEEGQNSLYTVQTLKISPDTRLQRLRTRSVRHEWESGPLHTEKQIHRLPLKTAEWEAYAQFSGVESCDRVGIKIQHSSSSQSTMLYFSPREETFVIRRPDLHNCSSSSLGNQSAKLQDEKAPFTLFTTRDPQTGIEEEERLKIHIFYDRSVVEVFVNERAVITTRVYLEDAECAAVEFFAEYAGAGGTVILEEAVAWDGLSNG